MKIKITIICLILFISQVRIAIAQHKKDTWKNGMKNPNDYKENNWYVRKIIIDGKLVP